ncbi:hypothetical protein [Streptomyces sp. NPDC093589]|uniref:hypothetical protein n=1 Tax=Streptomyces sp. NPDC093589 TaxID=3366043 RepID=UPI00380B47EA
MARKSPNHALGALLTEAEWSAADLARAVNSLGTAHGLRLRYDRTAVAHWLNGSRPRPPVAELVAQAFSRRIGRTLTPADTGLGEPGVPGDVLAALLDTGDPVRRLSALCRADSDPTRRPLLAQAVFSTSPPAFPGWGTGPRTAPPAGSRRQATGEDVARLETMALCCAAMGEKYGGAHGRSALALYLSEDVARLLTSPAPPPVRRELFTGAGHLTLLLAGMTFDVGHPGLAQHYYAVALELAHAAEDRAAYAITLRCMSVQAHRLRDHRQAVALGEAALDVAGSAVPSATRAFLHAGRAVVAAGVGQHGSAATHLLAAEKQLAQTCGPEGPFTSYPESALRYQRAETLSLLGDHTGARAELQSSLVGRPADHNRARALLHARLAHALLATKEVEAAVQHCLHFLEHYERLATGSAHGTLARLLLELTPYRRNPKVRAFRERLRET